MSFTLLLNVLLVVFLATTIVYLIVLNKKLAVLRRDKSDLEKMTASFGEATVRAEESIHNLKGTADELQSRISKAQALADDLAFLIDRGSSAADRLEDSVRSARETVPPKPKMPVDARAETPAETAPTPPPASRAPQQAPAAPARAPARAPAPAPENIAAESGTINPASVVAAAMEAEEQEARAAQEEQRPNFGASQMAFDDMPPPEEKGVGTPRLDDDFDDANGRSDAERALLKALRTAR